MKLQHSLPPESQVDANKRVLYKLQSRVKYLKGSRLSSDGDSDALAHSTLQHLEHHCQSTQQSINSGHPSTAAKSMAVIAQPEVVKCDQFTVGQLIELEFLLLNRGRVGRRIRVLPPSLSCLTLRSVIMPAAGDSSMLAPGTTARVRLIFKPESLRPMREIITVCTEEGTISVPVELRRPRPVTTLTPEIDLGAALLHSQLVARLPCDPVTAASQGMRAWVVPSNAAQADLPSGGGVSDDASAGSTDTNTVHIGCFTVSPASFTLPAALTIGFCPRQVKQYDESFVLRFEDGSEFSYRVSARGTSFAVEPVSLDNQPLQQLTVDDAPQAFDTALSIAMSNHTDTSHRRQLVLRSGCGVRMLLSWQHGSSSAAPARFKIAPSSLVLAPHAEAVFEIEVDSADLNHAASMEITLLAADLEADSTADAVSVLRCNLAFTPICLLEDIIFAPKVLVMDQAQQSQAARFELANPSHASVEYHCYLAQVNDAGVISAVPGRQVQIEPSAGTLPASDTVCLHITGQLVTGAAALNSSDAGATWQL